ncbi:helix-turn-helix transcriptional regulator [Phycisphaerales bacterium AB-hyl4]|uniref:Helix-turn-helix transcriptional regulator n=1 Tax=Natronomicrosphaera hydrolytica TaxID=3242702 RepID=A0ABV4U8M7_9BACT
MPKPKQPTPRLLSSKEVAKIVGYSVPTVIRWAEMGMYDFPQPAIEGKRGRGKRWHSDDLDDWLKSIRTK